MDVSPPSINPPTQPTTCVIEFVVMAAPEDLNANADFVRLADRFVEVGRSTTHPPTYVSSTVLQRKEGKT